MRGCTHEGMGLWAKKMRIGRGWVVRAWVWELVVCELGVWELEVGLRYVSVHMRGGTWGLVCKGLHGLGWGMLR